MADSAPQSRSDETRLTGRRVMVVEDEVLVSMLLEEMLADLGCEVVGPMLRVDDALAAMEDAASQAFDLAILDMHVAGESCLPVAERLADRGAPFILATGYDDLGSTGPLRDRPMLRKPFTFTELEAALLKALAEG